MKSAWRRRGSGSYSTVITKYADSMGPADSEPAGCVLCREPSLCFRGACDAGQGYWVASGARGFHRVVGGRRCSKSWLAQNFIFTFTIWPGAGFAVSTESQREG